MHRKRTTAPDGIRDVMGPPNGRPVKGAGPRQRRITPGRAARVAVELARERRQLEHVPTLAQLEAMARLGGSRPCSYRLDRKVNWLPESLPADFPHGASGLCFARAGRSSCCPAAPASRSPEPGAPAPSQGRVSRRSQ
jgi:hypothetical protein